MCSQAGCGLCFLGTFQLLSCGPAPKTHAQFSGGTQHQSQPKVTSKHLDTRNAQGLGVGPGVHREPMRVVPVVGGTASPGRVLACCEVSCSQAGPPLCRSEAGGGASAGRTVAAPHTHRRSGHGTSAAAARAVGSVAPQGGKDWRPVLSCIL